MKLLFVVLFIALVTFVRTDGVKKSVAKPAPTVDGDHSYHKMYEKLRKLEAKLSKKLTSVTNLQKLKFEEAKKYRETHEKNVNLLKTLFEKASEHEKAMKAKYTSDSQEYKKAEQQFQNIKKRFEQVSVDLIKANAALKKTEGDFQESKKLRTKEKRHLDHELNLIRQMLQITSVHMSK